MKYVKKVFDDYSIKNLFKEHISKFNFKHEQELLFLEDVRSFVEKKNQIELQYAQSLSKLCSQYQSKREYQIENDIQTSIYVPEKWKLLLEQYNYLAEKKQVGCRSMLMQCDYFKNIREQKIGFHHQALNHLKKLQEVITETNRNCENSYRTYCMEQYLANQLKDSTKLHTVHLEKKLKQRSINVSKFKRLYEELVQNNTSAEERQRKIDIAKLNYVTAIYCQNQQLQYYYSMELPELMHLQNANLDSFINDCLNSLSFKEIETSKFLISLFSEVLSNVAWTTPSVNEIGTEQQKSSMTPSLISEEYSSGTYFLNSNSCFNNLIQFELQSFDEEFETEFKFEFKRENVKFLSSDYEKWFSKMTELEQLMKRMVVQINQKRMVTYTPNHKSSSNDTIDNIDQDHEPHEEEKKRTSSFVQASSNDYKINEKIEEERYLIAEKKMQMIHLQAKIDALGSFNISLKELDQYNSANKFEENRKEFESDLRQNLVLWDVLMKSIDDLQFSDDSYDVDIQRKESFSDCYNSSSRPSSSASGSTAVGMARRASDLPIDPSLVPRFARVKPDASNMTMNSNDEPIRVVDSIPILNCRGDMSLMIYNEMTPGYYLARDTLGTKGLVPCDSVEFYEGEPTYVQSVFHYEGLDDQELTFPADVYIRLLRKNQPNKKIDGEDWWEGVYENKIGFFPAIFVHEVNAAPVPPRKIDDDIDKAELSQLDITNGESPALNNETLIDTSINQQVPN